MLQLYTKGVESSVEHGCTKRGFDRIRRYLYGGTNSCILADNTLQHMLRSVLHEVDQKCRYNIMQEYPLLRICMLHHLHLVSNVCDVVAKYKATGTLEVLERLTPEGIPDIYDINFDEFTLLDPVKTEKTQVSPTVRRSKRNASDAFGN